MSGELENGCRNALVTMQGPTRVIAYQIARQRWIRSHSLGLQHFHYSRPSPLKRC
jgi:hypothetical protein